MKGKIVKFFLILVLIIIAVAIPTSASADKNTATINLVQAAPYSLGETVNFSVTSNVSFTWVQVQCSQNGNVVFSQIEASDNNSFNLGPTTLRNSGPASCEAGVWTQKNGSLGKQLVSMLFDVSG